MRTESVDTSLDVHSEVTGNVTFQDTVLAHARIELDMNTCRPLINIVKYYFTPICRKKTRCLECLRNARWHPSRAYLHTST